VHLCHWISPRYSPFLLGARFENYEPFISLIFQFFFLVAVNRRYGGSPVLQFLHAACFYNGLSKGSTLLERLREHLIGQLASIKYSITKGVTIMTSYIIFKFSCLGIQCFGRSKSISVCTFKNYHTCKPDYNGFTLILMDRTANMA